jgi:hypothetical protein
MKFSIEQIYVNVLVEAISGLLLISFINFGTAIYHKVRRGK